jgi:hypothetical protein
MIIKSAIQTLKETILAVLASIVTVLASLLLLTAAAPAVAAATSAEDGPAAAPAEAPLVRVTSSFDVKHAGAVLRQVAKLMHSGFLRRDAETVAKDIDALPAEQSQRWSFSVTYKRLSYPLQIRARLDDFGMLDLDFFCPASMAGPLRGAVDGYLNSRGL